MAKYLIADFITEFSPKYDTLKNLAKPFEFFGDSPVEIKINVSDNQLNELFSKMNDNASLQQTEEFAYATAFNHAIIKRGAMLVHSSAIVLDGNAFLFSAPSGVGKSTHTRLWQKAFGTDRVRIINDDKPVVRVFEDKCIVYGTPFDGGSGIAINDSAKLKAVVFIKRGKENSIRKANTSEIIENMYLCTTRIVNKSTANILLQNIENIMKYSEFYLLTCNTDISAAYTAYDALIK